MKATQELAKVNPEKGNRESYRTPEYTVRASDDDYVAEVAIPGVPKDGVEISVENDLLTVIARRSDDLPENWKPLSRELNTADYRLKLELNAPVDTDRISAKVEDGILTLTLPVREAAKPRLIKVD